MYILKLLIIFAAYLTFNTYIFMNKTPKRQRFEKVAGNRVQRIITTLQLLGNCSNRNNYEYTESDVELMFSEISKALKDARAAYTGELNKANKQGFMFK